jgi:hypothetical protein
MSKVLFSSELNMFLANVLNIEKTDGLSSGHEGGHIICLQTSEQEILKNETLQSCCHQQMVHFKKHPHFPQDSGEKLEAPSSRHSSAIRSGFSLARSFLCSRTVDLVSNDLIINIAK